MNLWRATILAACVAALAGCGTAAPKTAATPGHSRPPRASAAGDVLYLLPAEQVPFTGDAVIMTVQASAGPGAPRWLRLARVTIGFGDGTSGSAGQSCAGGPPPARGLSLAHRYGRPGLLTARVTSASVCGQAGQPDLAGVSAALRVLPSAPPASASWPACTGAGAVLAARGTGAGLGHVGVLFTVHNASARGCALSGYPGLRLLGRRGPLPTTVHEAVSGTYLFPPVAPHRVALPPGGYAAFELEYEDNPSGPQASEPYAEACPAAIQAGVTLPGTAAAGVVPVAIAPCEGDVWVSAVFPGRQWINFP
jgi:hypothetical protein